MIILPRQARDKHRENGPFEPFLNKNDLFTKADSGQTSGKLKKETRVFLQTLRVLHFSGTGCGAFLIMWEKADIFQHTHLRGEIDPL
eukprot:COSAG06_NODE_1256_length_10087_cov_7.646676_4_plen_87_part_00